MLLKNVSFGMNSYVRFLDQVQFKQLSEIEHDTIIATERYTLDISLYELACSIATAFRQAGGAQARVQGDASNAVFVICENKRLWAYVSKGEGSRPLDKIRSSHSITLWGIVDEVRTVLQVLDSKYKTRKSNVVRWAYTADNGLQYKTIVVDEPHEIHQEFYPFIPDVKTYFERFMNSDAQVIIMTGAPGTGKTSLLRWGLAHYRYRATITYESKLVRNDELFIDFLTSTETDFLIFEDVDLLLAPREGAENEVMSKFLNLTDGLIKFPRKKIVFSTNLSDNGRIDPALTRPGRCFDAPEFRPLTYQEACAAAEVAGLPEPENECTLAELFNRGSRHYTRRQVGFLSGRNHFKNYSDCNKNRGRSGKTNEETRMR